MKKRMFLEILNRLLILLNTIRDNNLDIIFIYFSLIITLLIYTFTTSNIIHAVLGTIFIFLLTTPLLIYLNLIFFAVLIILIYVGAILVLLIFSILIIGLNQLKFTRHSIFNLKNIDKSDLVLNNNIIQYFNLFFINPKTAISPIITRGTFFIGFLSYVFRTIPNYSVDDLNYEYFIEWAEKPKSLLHYDFRMFLETEGKYDYLNMGFHSLEQAYHMIALHLYIDYFLCTLLFGILLLGAVFICTIILKIED